MSKSKKKDRKLRREVEILRAQLTNSDDTKKVRKAETKFETNSTNIGTDTKQTNPVTTSDFVNVDDKYIKQDLIKSILISFVIFSVIIGIWITQ